jgi:hypothetical protein
MVKNRVRLHTIHQMMGPLSRPFVCRSFSAPGCLFFIDLYIIIVLLSLSQKPGEMEAQMAEVGTAYVMKNILTTRKTGPPIFPKGEYGTGFNPDTPDTLPSWLTEDDLAYFVSKFEKTGFTGALNYYRNFNL